jgi:uncharacterized protein YpuA (DUF1002 family)
LTFFSKPAGEILLQASYTDKPPIMLQPEAKYFISAGPSTVVKEVTIIGGTSLSEGETFPEQRQFVESRPFIKEVDVVETKETIKTVEVIEPPKVTKELECNETVPVTIKSCGN